MIGDRCYKEEVISRTCTPASFLCSAANHRNSQYPQASSTGFSPEIVVKSPANIHRLAGNRTIWTVSKSHTQTRWKGGQQTLGCASRLKMKIGEGRRLWR